MAIDAIGREKFERQQSLSSKRHINGSQCFGQATHSLAKFSTGTNISPGPGPCALNTGVNSLDMIHNKNIVKRCRKKMKDFVSLSRNFVTYVSLYRQKI